MSCFVLLSSIFLLSPLSLLTSSFSFPLLCPFFHCYNTSPSSLFSSTSSLCAACLVLSYSLFSLYSINFLPFTDPLFPLVIQTLFLFLCRDSITFLLLSASTLPPAFPSFSSDTLSFYYPGIFPFGLHCRKFYSFFFSTFPTRLCSVSSLFWTSLYLDNVRSHKYPFRNRSNFS